MFERYCHEVDHEIAYIATQKDDACYGDFVNALKKKQKQKLVKKKIAAIKDAFSWEVIANNVEANSILTDRYVHISCNNFSTHFFYRLH